MVRVRWSRCVFTGLVCLGLGLLARGPSSDAANRAAIYGAEGPTAWSELTLRLAEFTQEFNHVILHRVQFCQGALHLDFTFTGRVGLRGAAALRAALVESGLSRELRTTQIRLLHHRNCCGRHGDVNEVLLLQVCLVPSPSLRVPPAPGALTLVAPCRLVVTHPEMSAHGCSPIQ